MKTVFEKTLPTVNRGRKLFTVSVDAKGKFFAHEIGERTQWAEVIGKDQLKAHRLNPTKKHGNQHGRRFRLVGMPTVIEAKRLIYDRAQTYVQYC